MLHGASGEETVGKDRFGQVPTHFATRGPKTVPRVDYERIFVLDDQMKLLAEYALRDDCPLETEDFWRSIPVSGLRHLLPFYQGEYVFTPFRVEGLWLVVLTNGAPRTEDRGSIGTLLAAMRAHLPTSLVPALAEKEARLREWERQLERRESTVMGREAHVGQVQAELEAATASVRELETSVRARETRLNALRDYALAMQDAIRAANAKRRVPGGPEENPRGPDASEVSAPPP